MTYLPAQGVDGVFGMRTWHAVVALQGWSRVARDGIVGPRTRAALRHAHRPKPWSKTTGFEVHIAQQVLLLVRGGRSCGSSFRTSLSATRRRRDTRLNGGVLASTELNRTALGSQRKKPQLAELVR